MVPRINPRIFKAQRLVNNKARSHYNNILIMSSTCHLWELNSSGEDNNHSSQPPKLNSIDNLGSFMKHNKSSYCHKLCDIVKEIKNRSYISGSYERFTPKLLGGCSNLDNFINRGCYPQLLYIGVLVNYSYIE
jgi:hypothetical protein